MFVFFSCNAEYAERRKMGNEVENAGTIKWHPGFYSGMKLRSVCLPTRVLIAGWRRRIIICVKL